MSLWLSGFLMWINPTGHVVHMKLCILIVRYVVNVSYPEKRNHQNTNINLETTGCDIKSFSRRTLVVSSGRTVHYATNAPGEISRFNETESQVPPSPPRRPLQAPAPGSHRANRRDPCIRPRAPPGLTPVFPLLPRRRDQPRPPNHRLLEYTGTEIKLDQTSQQVVYW